MARNLVKLVLFLPLLRPSVLLAQPQKTSSKQLAAEVDRLNWEGIELSNDTRYQEAAERFQKAIILDDTRAARSYHNIAYTYELAGDKNKALENYQKAVARNPQQVVSWQSLGKLQYEMGLYKDAVFSGETVLKLDPRNTAVQKWLPDAYAKLAEQKLYDARNDLSGDPTTNPNCEARPEVIAEVGFFASAIGVVNKQATAVSLYRTPGLLVVPVGAYAEFNPLRELTLRMNAQSPYFGVLQPAFYSGSQRLELQYNFKYFFMGGGLLFSQISADRNIPGQNTTYLLNTEYSSLSDSKFGLFFGGRDELTYFVLKVYPRYLFRDAISAPRHNSLDVARVDLEYRHNLRLSLGSVIDEKQPISKGPFTELILRVVIDEAYITEYQPPSGGDAVGHFFAIYDFSIGMEFGKLRYEFDKVGKTWGFLFTQRLYYQDTKNSNTTSFGNGQGYFGLNTSGATQGAAFSSLRNTSFITTLFGSFLFKGR
ncbi:MAG: tetratricopeptide repeat protein, partial [Leptospiraceae bacterium]|nr:tetratricopeptide repeat protein [Leptospiraceae bacterium]